MGIGEIVYLGDSVYATYDGFYIKLFTSNGVEEKNIIYLDRSVVDHFFAFCNEINEVFQKTETDFQVSKGDKI